MKLYEHVVWQKLTLWIKWRKRTLYEKYESREYGIYRITNYQVGFRPGESTSVHLLRLLARARAEAQNAVRKMKI